MSKIDTQEQAQQARHDFDNLNAFLSSGAGAKILKKLDEIEAQAVKAAFMGDTPESTNIIMERRGSYKAAKQIRAEFDAMEKDNTNALEWMKLNSPIKEEAPADTSSGEAPAPESEPEPASEE